MHEVGTDLSPGGEKFLVRLTPWVGEAGSPHCQVTETRP